MSTDSARRHLARLLEPVLEAAGLALEELTITPAGRRRVVRVVVDADRDVSLDEVAEASRAVSQALDEADALGDAPYTLEVTTPGVDRPLTLPRHWRRNVGRLVRLTLRSGDRVVGRVVSVDDGEVTVRVDDVERRVSLGEVERAVVQVEFNRPQDRLADEEA